MSNSLGEKVGIQVGDIIYNNILPNEPYHFNIFTYIINQRPLQFFVQNHSTMYNTTTNTTNTNIYQNTQLTNNIHNIHNIQINDPLYKDYIETNNKLLLLLPNHIQFKINVVNEKDRLRIEKRNMRRRIKSKEKRLEKQVTQAKAAVEDAAKKNTNLMYDGVYHYNYEEQHAAAPDTNMNTLNNNTININTTNNNEYGNNFHYNDKQQQQNEIIRNPLSNYDNNIPTGTPILNDNNNIHTNATSIMKF